MIKKILFWPIVLLNILCCAGFLISGFSYLIPPVEHPTLALAPFAFPFFAIGVLFFMAFWIFISWKYAFISILTLLIGHVPMQKYAPITGPDEETSDNALKLISYNVHGYSMEGVPGRANSMDLILDYLKHSDADIVCLQESYFYPGQKERVDSIYKYVESFEDQALGIGVACLSKYPIEKVEKIEYESKGNLSACFYVRYKGELLRVMNNHLESIKLDQDDKDGFKSYIKKTLEDDSEGMEGSLRIADHIKKAAVIRQKQAEAIADLVGENPRNTIVLGDFNDTPLSYTNHVIGKNLTDCYAERGWLTGFSYANHGMYVRIDHTFCSNDFEVTKCFVDDMIDYSDHYPIITYLTKGGK